MRLRSLAGVWLLRVGLPALAISGCNATYAPPARAIHYGAPGRLEQGRVELSGAVGGFGAEGFVTAPAAGGPQAAIGLKDWAALEVGGNFSSSQWALGYMGPRFSFVPHRESPFHLIADVEAGVGVGVGGFLYSNEPKSKDCPDCDGRPWDHRFAIGGYEGIGLGYQMRWFSLFVRARLEESAARNVPTTVWPSAMVGMEFNIKRRASINLGGGFTAFSNSNQTAAVGYYQLGVTLFIDAFVKRR